MVPTASLSVLCYVIIQANSIQSVFAKAFYLYVMCLYLKYLQPCLLEFENILISPQTRNQLHVFGYADCIFSLFVRTKHSWPLDIN